MKKQIENSNYTIDINGVVTNEKTFRKIGKHINQKGYECFNIIINNKGKNFKTHRLIGIYFIPNPNNLPCLNHKDGNKLNNSINNLEWCTLSENTTHAYKLGLISKKKKFDNKTEMEIVKMSNLKITQKEIADVFKTSQQTVFNIIKRNKLVGQNQ